MRNEIVVGRKSFGDIKKVLQDAKNWHNCKFDRLARFFRRIIFMCIQTRNFMTSAKCDSAPAGVSSMRSRGRRIVSRACGTGFPAAE
jgi:hypothetical protein